MQHLLASLLAALVAMGCAEPKTPSNSSGSGNGDSAMSDFDKSLEAFKAAVAADLDVSASKIKVSPSSEKVIGNDEYAVPGFVPFLALISGRSVGVAGWANASGLVISLQRKNFGPLMEAMGMAEPAPALSALEQARRVAWAHVGYRFVETVSDFRDAKMPADGGPPVLARAADGAVTLTFFMVESGDTGFQAAVRCVVTRDPAGTYTYSLART